MIALTKNSFVNIIYSLSRADLTKEQASVVIPVIESLVKDRYHLCSWWFDLADKPDKNMEKVIHDEGELYDTIIANCDTEVFDLKKTEKTNTSLKDIQEKYITIIQSIDNIKI